MGTHLAERRVGEALGPEGRSASPERLPRRWLVIEAGVGFRPQVHERADGRILVDRKLAWRPRKEAPRLRCNLEDGARQIGAEPVERPLRDGAEVRVM
eukprot:scaffold2419_cov114-Isochrysis_galbana.AAC.16